MDRRRTFLAKLPGLLCTVPMAAAALWPLSAGAAIPTLASTSPMDVVNSILSFRLARGAVTIEEFALVERWISPGLMQACSEYRRRLDGPNAVNIGVPSVETDPVTGAEEALSERFQLDAPLDKGGTQIVIAHLFHPDGTPYGSRRFVLANLPSYGWRITNVGSLRTQCEQGP